jgi:methyl-galactoside transport system substrate-binding protein
MDTLSEMHGIKEEIMKKLIPAVALVFGALLASCTTPAAQSGSTTGTKSADVFIYQYSDTYIGTVRTALDTDLKAKSIAATFYDGGGVSATQIQQIETAIAAKSKLLIPNLVEQTATGLSVSQKAKAAGIPAIFFNREVPNAAVTSTTFPDACFVGTDPDQAGYMQGDIIAGGLITADGKLSETWDQNKDGYISYVMLRADESNAEANGRTKYSVEEANTKLTAKSLNSLVHLGADYNAGWSKDTAKTAMDGFITTYGLPGSGKDDKKGGIELVIANNDDMALGAIQSLQGYNFNKGTGNTVMVVGVDATAAGKAAIDAGQMFGTVKQDAEAMATCIASLADNKLSGKDFLAGTSYKWDSDTVHKVRIPYSSYLKA